MKILRVVGSMNPHDGGVVEAINQGLREFNNDDYTMEVLCFDNVTSPWVNNEKYSKIHALGKGITAYNFNLKFISWLIKNARNYDLVIIDGLWQFYSFGGYLLKILKVKYCVFTHGMLDPYFNKDKLKYFKKLPFWFLIERNIISLADNVIFTCEDERLLAEQSFPLFKANACVATLGVEENKKSEAVLTKAFYSSFPELENKSFALFLSRIHPKKGLDLLIYALAEINEIPDDFYLAIAGPDSIGMKKDLIELSNKLNISHRIIWLGMLTGDTKWGSYYASDVFILPSHQENFGIVVAEALSTGTPVLTTNKVNIWREIQAYNAGLIEDDTKVGVRNLLKFWLTQCRVQKKLLSKNAGLCFESSFSTSVAKKEFHNIFQGTLDK